MLNGLDLFSGIGGISYALCKFVRPIAYCEIDDYARAVLLSRMASKQIHSAPIWDDIRTFEGNSFKRIVDIIYGGFPCQNISLCGDGKGLGGEQSRLYWEIHRLAREIFPKWIFLENVPSIANRGGLEIVKSLTEIGYGCRWCVLSAEGCGAPQKRERFYLLAMANSPCCWQYFCTGNAKTDIEMADSSQTRFNRIRNPQRIEKRQSGAVVSCLSDFWEKTESPFCGVDDGLPYRVDRIGSLGNSVCPQTTEKAFKYLMGIK